MGVFEEGIEVNHYLAPGLPRMVLMYFVADAISATMFRPFSISRSARSVLAKNARPSVTKVLHS
jgi:hypothetical protein